ncbi:MAG: ribose-phosphate pyrophosphokinase [Flavobacteriales bacterium]|jgi:ribose-phosphate pyrophosphokinase|nr:ribose-phosphate pyrophosphokinase [Flavobacteriales bacterium]|tara:strand:+ start:2402 stop:3331 length:930 start_codon:yes stop_codon:yes gene_type:complete
MESTVKIFSGRATRILAEQIAKNYGVDLGNIIISEFSDGEFIPSFEETVRGSKVFIIQSTPPPSDNLMELLLMIDAAKRASASQIVAVMPYFGMARQDRKDKPRVPIGAKLVTNMLTTAGATRVMTCDLHADQIQGFLEVPVDHLYASSVFVAYIRSLNLDNLTIASPDMGGSKRANTYAKHLGCEMVICYKHRKKANEIGDMRVIGEVKGKHVVLVDDMVDTAGTLTTAADMMIQQGALSVRAVCTHPVLSGSAYDRIEQSHMMELIVTDTLPSKKSPKIKILSIAPMFANVIKNVACNESISKNFIS